MLFLLLLWNFGFHPLRTALPGGAFSDFYDLQAVSLMDGHLDIEAGEAGIEAFIVNGKEFLYFPPGPAILRLPVMVFTDHWDGKLTALSMLGAWSVLVLLSGRLLWAVRQQLRPDEPLGRWELGLFGVLHGSICGGSVVLYLAALPWVYHEAYIWSIALTTGGMLLLIRLYQATDRQAVAMLAACVLGVVLVRTTAGWALAASAVLLAVIAWRGDRDSELRRLALPIALAGLVPLSIAIAVNWAKFQHPYLFPLDKQVFTGLSAQRRLAMEANGGDVVGARILPTTLVNYFRPDGVRFSGLFPYVTFPADPAPSYGGSVIDQSYRTGSVVAFMPLLFGLSIWGLVAMVRSGSRQATQALRVPVLGALACGGPVLLYGYLAYRYTSEFMPILILGSAIGMASLVTTWSGGTFVVKRRVLGVAVALCAFGAYANFASGVSTLSVSNPGTTLERYIRIQAKLADATGQSFTSHISQGDSLPRTAEVDDIWIVGDCDASFASNGDPYGPWELLSMAEWKFTIEPLADLPDDGDRVLIATVGEGAKRSTITVEVEPTRFRSVVVRPDGTRIGEWYPYPPGTSFTVEVLASIEFRVYSVEPALDDDKLVVPIITFDGDMNLPDFLEPSFRRDRPGVRAGHEAASQCDLSQLARPGRGPVVIADRKRQVQTAVRSTFRRPPPVGDDAGRVRWRRAGLAGAVPALLLQFWMLTAGTWNLFRWDRSADFYDAQARSLLDGVLAMDPRLLGIEAFRRGENAYMYQGPVPAFYRVPIVALTDRFDGRLGAASMLVGLIVFLVVLLGVGWRLRCMVLDRAEVTRGEQAQVAVLIFVLVGGSSLLYASSRSWVYHEAIVWGVAYTMASFSCLLLWLQYGARRFLVWASVMAALAMQTRASVGGGALAGLGIVLGCLVAGWIAARWGGTNRAAAAMKRLDWIPERPGAPRPGLWLTGAILVPLGAYAVINYIKFHQLFSVPFEQQQFTLQDPQRQAMLAANGGSLFNWKFLPTNLVQYWRPDMLSISGRWPFISFPQREVWLIGDPFYDLLDLTAGIPATMPLLVGLGIVGTVAIVRGSAGDLRALRPILLACVAGTLAVLNIGYIANRYQSDFLPLLAIPALVGAPLSLAWVRRHTPAIRSIVTALAVGAAVFTVLANLALGYIFQRAYAPVTPPAQIAGFVRTQLTVDGWFGDGRLPNVRQGSSLPEGGDYGDIFIVGDCDAVYWSDGMVTNAVKLSNWNGVERAEGQGAFEATVRFAEPAEEQLQPLLNIVGGSGEVSVFVLIDPITDLMSFGYLSPDIEWRGSTVELPFDQDLPMRMVLDPRVRIFELYIDGRLVLATGHDGGTEITEGDGSRHTKAMVDRFGGVITPDPIELSVCPDLLRSVER